MGKNVKLRRYSVRCGYYWQNEYKFGSLHEVVRLYLKWANSKSMISATAPTTDSDIRLLSSHDDQDGILLILCLTHTSEASLFFPDRSPGGKVKGKKKSSSDVHGIPVYLWLPSSEPTEIVGIVPDKHKAGCREFCAGMEGFMRTCYTEIAPEPSQPSLFDNPTVVMVDESGNPVLPFCKPSNMRSPAALDKLRARAEEVQKVSTTVFRDNKPHEIRSLMKTVGKLVGVSERRLLNQRKFKIEIPVNGLSETDFDAILDAHDPEIYDVEFKLKNETKLIGTRDILVQMVARMDLDVAPRKLKQQIMSFTW